MRKKVFLTERKHQKASAKDEQLVDIEQDRLMEHGKRIGQIERLKF